MLSERIIIFGRVGTAVVSPLVRLGTGEMLVEFCNLSEDLTGVVGAGSDLASKCGQEG